MITFKRFTLITLIAATVATSGNSHAMQPSPSQTDFSATTPDEITLIGAAESGDLEAVEEHIGRNVNVNATTIAGWTALIAAADRGHRAVVRRLLSAGANVNAQNSQGHTALYYAASGNRFDVAQELIDHDGDVTIRSNDGQTALHGAVYDQSFDLMSQEDAAQALEAQIQTILTLLAAPSMNHETVESVLTRTHHPEIIRILRAYLVERITTTTTTTTTTQ